MPLNIVIDMANAEHLEILKSGVEKWNRWIEKMPGLKPDLSNSSLKERDLSQINLEYCDLSYCDLYATNFKGANLHAVDFRGANLQKANLKETTLSAAEMRGLDLSHIDFQYANLYHAFLSYANLSYAKLNATVLENADLTGANLSKASLRSTNLLYASLKEANLEKADLTEANLTYANLESLNLTDSILATTVFGFTDLSTCLGLDTVQVNYPCTIDFQTLRASKNLPKSFLMKIGLPELYIDYLPEFYSEALSFYPAFLSHSWGNKDFARKLYEALIAKGVIVFFDEKKMKPGDDIYESISKGISLYDKMILVCSKESLSKSWWVDRELDRVLKKERDLFKERGKRINLLIPIRIDDFIFSWNGAKSEEVRRYVILDFKDWQDDTNFEKALNDLVHALNVDRPDIKPPSFL